MERARSSRGFTLLEILVVITLLSFVALVGLAWFRGMEKARLNGAVYRLRAFLKYSMLLSLQRSEDVVVFLKTDCSARATVGGEEMAKFKAPRGVKCEISGGNGSEQVIYVMEGYIQPVEIKVSSGERSRTLSTAEISIWGENATGEAEGED